MTDVKYKPTAHDHAAFFEKAMKREGFIKAYEDLEEEYSLVREKHSACRTKQCTCDTDSQKLRH